MDTSSSDDPLPVLAEAALGDLIESAALAEAVARVVEETAGRDGNYAAFGNTP